MLRLVEGFVDRQADPVPVVGSARVLGARRPETADIELLLEAGGCTIRATGPVDLVVLLHNPPRGNALDDCLSLCEAPGPATILVDLSDDPIDRILATEAGCEIVTAWPFNRREFIARVRGLLRRRRRLQETAPASPDVGGYLYDPVRRTMTRPAGGTVRLTANEHRILDALLKSPTIPLDDERLVDVLDGRDRLAPRSASVAAWRLKRKLQALAGEEVIGVVRGRGYLLMEPVRAVG